MAQRIRLRSFILIDSNSTQLAHGHSLGVLFTLADVSLESVVKHTNDSKARPRLQVLPRRYPPFSCSNS
jgi:hypothetical protein